MVKLVWFFIGLTVFLFFQIGPVADWIPIQSPDALEEALVFYTVFSFIGFAIAIGCGVLGPIVGAYNIRMKAIRFRETLKYLRSKKTIYEKLRDKIVEEIKIALTQTLPDFEKEVLQKCGPNSSECYVSAVLSYPDIKSHETILNYCDKFIAETKKIADIELDIEKTKTDQIIFTESLLFLKAFLPKDFGDEK